MEERSKALSTIAKGCVELFKESPGVALGITATVAAVTYAYRNNYLSFWGAKSEPPIEQTITNVNGNDAKILQKANKLAKQNIDKVQGHGADIEQNTADKESNTQGFPRGQSNH